MSTMTNSFTEEHSVESCPSQQERLAEFDERFWRCRGPLQFPACLILGGTDEAARAVERCWLRASRNPPSFEHEGESRNWLLRVLINEAVALLHKRQKQASGQSGNHAKNSFRA